MTPSQETSASPFPIGRYAGRSSGGGAAVVRASHGPQAPLWMHLCQRPSCVWAAAIEDFIVLIRTEATMKTCGIKLRSATSVEPRRAAGRRARAFRPIATAAFIRLAESFAVICLLLAL